MKLKKGIKDGGRRGKDEHKEREEKKKIEEHEETNNLRRWKRKRIIRKSRLGKKGTIMKKMKRFLEENV
jgi:hypothetical protein